ncbi:hypothetical protein AVEN_189895-1 [Araneus ventricosus]|uniref:Uncharacterized protein n=1 Tax=Araneus ventricosus TaxID=182803 RepID=A0A4Y2LYE9_ARAVE|nr:hypothetical protein AVEN_189895-1 [Araneus ventricosus]
MSAFVTRNRRSIRENGMTDVAITRVLRPESKYPLPLPKEVRTITGGVTQRPAINTHQGSENPLTYTAASHPCTRGSPGGLNIRKLASSSGVSNSNASKAQINEV